MASGFIMTKGRFCLAVCAVPALFGALLILPVPRPRKLIDLVGPTARAPDLTLRPTMLEEKPFMGFFGREEFIQIV